MPITTCSYGPFKRNAYGLGAKPTEDDEEDDMYMLPGDTTQSVPRVAAPSTGAKEATSTAEKTTMAVQDLLKNPELMDLINKLKGP